MSGVRDARLRIARRYRTWTTGGYVARYRLPKFRKAKNQKTYSRVIVYHDETKKIENTNLYGHILLFIPAYLKIEKYGTLFEDIVEDYRPVIEFYEKVVEIRKKYGANHKFHFNKIPRSGKWTKYNQCEKEFVELGIDALKTKRNSIFTHPLFFKMAIIFYPLSTLNMYGGDKKEKRLRYHETLFRMLLKGAIHYLYDEQNHVEILKIISDGKPYHRKLSEDRILWKLIIDDFIGEHPLREYVTISPNCEIIHQSSNHKDFNEDTEEYIHAHMLQLSDMLLGCVIHSCYKGLRIQKSSPSIGQEVKDKRGIIVLPVKDMLDKRKRGRNFKYSSHYKSFSLSLASLRNGSWNFENIMTKTIKIVPDAKQLTLSNILKGD